MTAPSDRAPATEDVDLIDAYAVAVRAFVLAQSQAARTGKGGADVLRTRELEQQARDDLATALQAEREQRLRAEERAAMWDAAEKLLEVVSVGLRGYYVTSDPLPDDVELRPLSPAAWLTAARARGAGEDGEV